MKRHWIIVTVTLMTTAAALGGGFDLSWNAITGGGGVGSDGPFTLTGTIGQTHAGVVMAGGGFSLAGGVGAIDDGGVPICPADLNGDSIVSVVDLLQVLAAWGGPGGDVTGDGTTDVLDLLALLAAWGSC